MISQQQLEAASAMIGSQLLYSRTSQPTQASALVKIVGYRVSFGRIEYQIEDAGGQRHWVRSVSLSPIQPATAQP